MRVRSVCVRAQVRERVRVCVRPGVRVCAVNYSRACVNKTGEFVRVVVTCIDGVDMQAGCVDHVIPGHEPEAKTNTEQLAHGKI